MRALLPSFHHLLLHTVRPPYLFRLFPSSPHHVRSSAAERRHLDSLAEGEGTVCFTLAAYVTEQANASDRIYLPSSALTSALEAKASFPLAFRCTVASAGTYPPSVKLSDKDFSNETSLTSSSSSSDLGANSILPVMHPTLEPPRPSSSTSFPADGDEAKHPSSASTYAPPVRAAYASVADFDALEVRHK